MQKKYYITVDEAVNSWRGPVVFVGDGRNRRRARVMKSRTFMQAVVLTAVILGGLSSIAGEVTRAVVAAPAPAAVAPAPDCLHCNRCAVLGHHAQCSISKQTEFACESDESCKCELRSIELQPPAR